jgi:hypothetical protein
MTPFPLFRSRAATRCELLCDPAALRATDDQRGTAPALDANHDATLRCHAGAVEFDSDLIAANSCD